MNYRKVSALMLALVIIFSFAACGSEDVGKTKGPGVGGVVFAVDWNTTVQGDIYMLLKTEDGKLMKTVSTDDLGNGTESIDLTNSYGFRRKDNSMDIRISAYKLSDTLIFYEYVAGVKAVGPNPSSGDAIFEIYELSADKGIELKACFTYSNYGGKIYSQDYTDPKNRKDISVDELKEFFSQYGITFEEIKLSKGRKTLGAVCEAEQILYLYGKGCDEPAPSKDVVAEYGIAE